MRINFTKKTTTNTNNYELIIKKILKRKKREMNVIFVDNKEIKEINNKYRKIDKATDVISFANRDNDFIIKTKELGDIFISIEKATEQASKYGHSIDREIGFLAVHGYLHLIGYDHQDNEGEKKMIIKQEKILKKAKLGRD